MGKHGRALVWLVTPQQAKEFLCGVILASPGSVCRKSTKLTNPIQESIPFAVIGSNTVVEAKGKRVRGRLYPWGIVEVENSAHCDFIKLRNMLVRTHMQDLKDVTRETHYENYRAQCIQSMTRMVVKERNRNKLTRESGTDFPIPMIPGASESETEKLIREKDEELRRMQEMLQRFQDHLVTQKDGC
ncbi:Septin-4 [Ataeniobius toweri]|uniref:Septin-4 n=1 Tax=Ataeniobius toweri TaxID=208326 RepID=A0ABU7ADG4_9TELE|nr:Septin-4 [Ataeniobius toweri]